MYHVRSVRIGLGAIALLILLQSHLRAQTPVKEVFELTQPSVPNASSQQNSLILLLKQRRLHLILKIKQRRVYVYQGDRLRTSYPVAVGKAGWETPIGNFKVLEMLTNPGWTNFKTGEVVPPGANNPLGERWIAFWTDGKDYVGFHGTPNKASVGKAISHGCVRMYNEHVRQLYSMVTIGTLVIVEP